MTERFKLSKWCGRANTSCVIDEQGLMLQGEVVDKLNEQHQMIEELNDIDLITTLIKENDQLKAEKKELERKLKNVLDTDGENQQLIFKLLEKDRELEKENEKLKQQLDEIEGQLLMFDMCDNWGWDRLMYTIRHIAEIVGYDGGIKHDN